MYRALRRAGLLRCCGFLLGLCLLMTLYLATWLTFEIQLDLATHKLVHSQLNLTIRQGGGAVSKETLPSTTSLSRSNPKSSSDTSSRSSSSSQVSSTLHTKTSSKQPLYRILEGANIFINRIYSVWNHSYSSNSSLLQSSSKTSSKHRLCIIVPFRDRFEELQIFAPHLHAFLSNQAIDYRLLIMNQVDQYRFNRASLINVGYFESKRIDCDYLSMHDVDLLPLNQELSYRFPEEGPFHLASPDYHPRYHYKKFIGGILLITLDHFKKAKGLSNKYWGWGLEDDEFFLRIRDSNLTIYRPTNLTTDVNDTFMHIHDKKFRKRDTLRIGNQKKVSRKRDRLSGVDTVLYEILSRVPMRIETAEVTVINVRLYCDLEWTPWCEFPLNYP